MNRAFNLMVAVLLVATVFIPINTLADEVEEKGDKGKIPNHVLNISKENTYPNSAQDETILEPSELAEELITEAEIMIENHDLIRILNESSLKPSPIAFGYRGMIYMGHWPLNYQSENTNVNWEYQKINKNQINNIGGSEKKKLNYKQKKEKRIKGGLTAKVDRADDIKKMMLQKAKANTKLPLAFETIIGQGTKKEQSYSIPQKKVGTLNAYAPAVNEKGVVTFGEVYLKLKGSKKFLVVKNVTKQGIGAWIPVQDHVSFSFHLSDDWQ